MGKPTGFIEFMRRDPVYRPVVERLKDYRAVEIPLSSAEIREQAARCMDCGTPFCHGVGCPLGNLVPEFNDLIWNHRWHDAVELLWQQNPFADITSRVCPAPCESACVLGISEQPVAIRQIETALVEWGYDQGVIKPEPPTLRRAEHVAIIGSGPAGMATAHRLNQLGFSVVVYESAHRPGGLLRYGIPEFKLEKRVLDRRLDLMRAEGIIFECNVHIGDDLSYRYLTDRYQALCLAFGAREPRDLAIPGRELNGIHFAMDYLTAQNRRLQGEQATRDADLCARNRHVVIIGGGDTGADCLGTALRQGARHVVQLEILPEPPTVRPAHTPWPDWPDVLRVSSSHHEGGERRWATATLAFLSDDNKDRVKALRCVNVDWVKTKGGNQPREKPETEHEVPADLVLLALGFTGMSRNTRLPPELEAIRQCGNRPLRDETGMTAIPGIFLAGDAGAGASLAVRALADGIRIANTINLFLTPSETGDSSSC